MKVQVVKCKQYCSTYKNIVMVDGVPVCITKGQSTAAKIISYLNGYVEDIADGKIKKKLDKILGGDK